MSKLTLNYSVMRPRPQLTQLKEDVTSREYNNGYFQYIYDLPLTSPDLAYQLDAKEWIALLEHTWNFVYNAAMEDGKISEVERMDLNNIHKLRNFYSAQLRAGQKLTLHHSFVKQVHAVKDLEYDHNRTNKYDPKPENSINNINSPYYVPKPWELRPNPRYTP